MVRLCVLTIILISIALEQAYAQFQFGVKGGANFATVSNPNVSDNSLNPEMKIAYHAGLFANSRLSDKFSLATDLLYSNKGYNNAEVNFRFHYFSIPLLLNYNVLNNLKVGIGPEFGLLLSSYFRLNGDSFDVSSLYSNDIDIGLDAGVQYEINEKVNVGLRYNHGLSNILGDSQLSDLTGNPIDAHISNRVIQLYIEYVLVRK